MLRLGIAPGKLYRATFICQDGLCCCNMALISFRLFRKNLGNLRDFFGQMVYRPPWQKISRTPMIQSDRPDKNVRNPETLTENSNENLVSPLSYTSFKIVSQFTGFSRKRFPPKRIEASEMSSKREEGNGERKIKEVRWREWES